MTEGEEKLGPVVISMTTHMLVRPILKVVDGKLMKVGEVPVDEASPADSGVGSTKPDCAVRLGVELLDGKPSGGAGGSWIPREE